MARLTATLTSKLAKDVYEISKYTAKDAILTLRKEYGTEFSLVEKNVLKARVGGPAGIKISSGFGCVLVGTKNFKGQAFIMFRGTKSLGDWLTNANIAPGRSSTGHSVHDGFNMAFNSMKEQLRSLIQAAKKQGATTFHCIGHSLGGALATLCANWLKKSETVYLYTYGSPRVGFFDFANFFTTQMSNDNIYRVYHKTDPVPMIPTWPYVHVPETGVDYKIYSPGIVPSPYYHGMNQYCLSVAGKSWSALSAYAEPPKNDISIQRWLANKARAIFSMETLEWLENSLTFILRKLSISTGAANNFTVMDHLAYVLAKGIELADHLSMWVRYFLGKLMEVIGLKSSNNETIFSRKFIKELLSKLQRKINQSVETALRLGE